EWCQHLTVRFKGIVFIDDVMYKGKQAAEKLHNLIQEKGLEFTLKKLQGHYVIIYTNDKQLSIISDLVRSFPVFYTLTGANIYISDDAYAICDRLKNVQLDKISVEEF